MPRERREAVRRPEGERTVKKRQTKAHLRFGVRVEMRDRLGLDEADEGAQQQARTRIELREGARAWLGFRFGLGLGLGFGLGLAARGCADRPRAAVRSRAYWAHGAGRALARARPCAAA